MSIRFACESDLPQILAIYRPYVENTVYSLEYDAPDLEEFTRRFRQITEHFSWLVWEENKKILGYAYGSLPFHRTGYKWSAEVSIYLHADVHRKGIGSALYGALEALLRLQGYRTVYAIITAANEGSLAFHSALGYRQAAYFTRCAYKFQRWVDVVWMEKELQIVDSPSTFPCSISDIVKNNRNLCDILAKMSLF